MLEIQDHGAVREIRLDRPPANALNGELIDALTAALQTAGKEADAVVISGAGRLFCAGLDVPELLQLDRSRFAVLWDAFTGLMQIIATLPVPVVFAMQGHALAGGALLALFGDYRIMPRGPFKTGLNEVQVGLIAPTPVHQALVRLVGPNRAGQMLVSGEVMDAEKAHAIGLVDELADTPAVRRFALETLARGAGAFILPGPTQRVDFSPDGRWLAYGSNVSGRFEVYVRPYPGSGPGQA